MLGALVSVNAKGQTSRKFQITQNPFQIGNSKECDLRIEGPGILKRHCTITFNNALARIKSESKLIEVNDKAEASTDLKNGDKILIGNRTFVWEYPKKPESKTNKMANSNKQNTKKRKSEPLFKTKLVAVVTPQLRESPVIKSVSSVPVKKEGSVLGGESLVIKSLKAFERGALEYAIDVFFQSTKISKDKNLKDVMKWVEPKYTASDLATFLVHKNFGTKSEANDVKRTSPLKLMRSSSLKTSTFFTPPRVTKKKEKTVSKLPPPLTLEELLDETVLKEFREEIKNRILKSDDDADSDEESQYPTSIKNRVRQARRLFFLKRKLLEKSAARLIELRSPDVTSPKSSPKPTELPTSPLFRRVDGPSFSTNTEMDCLIFDNIKRVLNTPDRLGDVRSPRFMATRAEIIANEIVKQPDKIRTTIETVQAKATEESAVAEKILAESRSKDNSRFSNLVFSGRCSPRGEPGLNASGMKVFSPSKNASLVLQSSDSRKSPSVGSPSSPNRSLRIEGHNSVGPSQGGNDGYRTPSDQGSPSVVLRSSRKTGSIAPSSPQTPLSALSKKTRSPFTPPPTFQSLKRKLEALSVDKAERAAKKLKSEPPKSPDKNKMAALMVCHGKANRPLFSDIVKNGVPASRSEQVPTRGKSPKLVIKKTKFLSQVPAIVNSNRHINSPDPIVIYKKTIKSPVPAKKTRKGRKSVQGTIFGNSKLELSGVEELFKTPAKAQLTESPVKSPSKSPSKSELCLTELFSSSSQNEPMEVVNESPVSEEEIMTALDLARKSQLPPKKPVDHSRRSRRLKSVSNVSFKSPASHRPSTSKNITITEGVPLPTPKKSVSFVKEAISGRLSRATRSGSSSPAVTFKARSMSSSPKRVPLRPILKSTPSVDSLAARPSETSPRKSSSSPTQVNRSSLRNSKPRQSTPFKVNPRKSTPKSAVKFLQTLKESDSSYNDSLKSSPSSSFKTKRQRGSASETEGTNFDFDGIITPDVTQDVFVSSISSSPVLYGSGYGVIVSRRSDSSSSDERSFSSFTRSPSTLSPTKSPRPSSSSYSPIRSTNIITSTPAVKVTKPSGTRSSSFFSPERVSRSASLQSPLTTSTSRSAGSASKLSSRKSSENSLSALGLSLFKTPKAKTPATTKRSMSADRSTRSVKNSISEKRRSVSADRYASVKSLRSTKKTTINRSVGEDHSLRTPLSSRSADRSVTTPKTPASTKKSEGTAKSAKKLKTPKSQKSVKTYDSTKRSISADRHGKTPKTPVTAKRSVSADRSAKTLKTPVSAKRSTSADRSVKTPKTPEAKRSVSADRSAKTLKTPMSAKRSISAERSSKTPKTPAAKRSVNADRSSKTPKTPVSAKRSISADRSSKTPKTPVSAKRSISADRSSKTPKTPVSAKRSISADRSSKTPRTPAAKRSVSAGRSAKTPKTPTTKRSVSAERSAKTLKTPVSAKRSISAERSSKTPKTPAAKGSVNADRSARTLKTPVSAKRSISADRSSKTLKTPVSAKRSISADRSSKTPRTPAAKRSVSAGRSAKTPKTPTTKRSVSADRSAKSTKTPAAAKRSVSADRSAKSLNTPKAVTSTSLKTPPVTAKRSVSGKRSAKTLKTPKISTSTESVKTPVSAKRSASADRSVKKLKTPKSAKRSVSADRAGIASKSPVSSRSNIRTDKSARNSKASVSFKTDLSSKTPTSNRSVSVSSPVTKPTRGALPQTPSISLTHLFQRAPPSPILKGGIKQLFQTLPSSSYDDLSGVRQLFNTVSQGTSPNLVGGIKQLFANADKTTWDPEGIASLFADEPKPLRVTSPVVEASKPTRKGRQVKSEAPSKKAKLDDEQVDFKSSRTTRAGNQATASNSKVEKSLSPVRKGRAARKMKMEPVTDPVETQANEKLPVQVAEVEIVSSSEEIKRGTSKTVKDEPESSRRTRNARTGHSSVDKVENDSEVVSSSTARGRRRKIEVTSPSPAKKKTRSAKTAESSPRVTDVKTEPGISKRTRKVESETSKSDKKSQAVKPDPDSSGKGLESAETTSPLKKGRKARVGKIEPPSEPAAAPTKRGKRKLPEPERETEEAAVSPPKTRKTRGAVASSLPKVPSPAKGRGRGRKKEAVASPLEPSPVKKRGKTRNQVDIQEGASPSKSPTPANKRARKVKETLPSPPAATEPSPVKSKARTRSNKEEVTSPKSPAPVKKGRKVRGTLPNPQVAAEPSPVKARGRTRNNNQEVPGPSKSPSPLKSRGRQVKPSPQVDAKPSPVKSKGRQRQNMSKKEAASTAKLLSPIKSPSGRSKPNETPTPEPRKGRTTRSKATEASSPAKETTRAQASGSNAASRSSDEAPKVEPSKRKGKSVKFDSDIAATARTSKRKKT